MKETEKELDTQKPAIFVIDGVGGSGKSHVINLLANELGSYGIQTAIQKISGFGNSPRAVKLREIMAFREKLISSGCATEKQIFDKQRDRIFRLATRHQFNLFQKALQCSTNKDAILLDRTPLVSYVYAMASNPENVFLPEIVAESLKMTFMLKAKRIYFLDVSPVTAYARLISRCCENREQIQNIVDECAGLSETTEDKREAIKMRALNLLTLAGNEKKTLSDWDLIPYSVMDRECSIYKEIYGNFSNVVIINAEMPIEKVVQTALADIQTQLAK